MTQPTVFIFDLDYCLSDDTPRRLLAMEGNYRAYHDKCDEDDPINADVPQSMVQHPKDQFIFITGRDEPVREKTLHWIARHFPWLSDHPTTLLMRPKNDSSPSAKLKIQLLNQLELEPHDIAAAFDDRRDVLEAYRGWGIKETYVLSKTEYSRYPKLVPTKTQEPDELLSEMADTFRARNKVYGNNYERVGRIMEILHGNDAPSPARRLVGTAHQFNIWHLYELMIVKLTRFANSGLEHRDSIHDMAVYAAMIESLLGTEEKEDE